MSSVACACTKSGSRVATLRRTRTVTANYPVRGGGVRPGPPPLRRVARGHATVLVHLRRSEASRRVSAQFRRDRLGREELMALAAGPLSLPSVIADPRPPMPADDR